MFSGNVLVDNHYGIKVQGTPSATIERNTFDANGTAISITQGSNPLVARNVIYRGALGIYCFFFVAPVFSCNNVYGASIAAYAGDCGDQTGLNGNFSADPQFCGIAGTGNYYLQSDSPCAPGNHPDGADCGVIGARETKCGTVRTSTVTWGQMKALYRDKK
jgi:hypothetical protein